ncbi:hypothetical protein GCM10009557_63980 [Virgisporangium ochraceum]|uniref:Peptidoglycan binding-like domain-containing protein n=1 Tax=Virgisporangium ochraceum TaxID=65505 RepID=A0A8J4EDA0_9ACTN|nr:peptidoglycan-binding domain-containing protein [Virgisporangium ochraceum]GIJ70494.1 hypothetical protein Voc01_054110 [Virgisporangium ochraceum]
MSPLSYHRTRCGRSALQTSLADAGYYRGSADGVYGPQTVEAVPAATRGTGSPGTGGPRVC